MNKQPTTIRRYLLRGAFLLSLAFVIVMPLALGQTRSRGSKPSVAAAQMPQVAQRSTDTSQLPYDVLTPNLSPWTIVANYPFVVESTAVCSDGTFAYVAGGFVNFGGTDSFNRYDPVANTWTTLATLPETLSHARAAYAANVNKVYVFGGFGCCNFRILDTTYIYDVATNSWTTGATMPAPRWVPNVAYYSANRKIYVIGGDGWNQTWEYDPVGNTWNTTRAPVPVLGMGGSVTSIVGQYIYLASSDWPDPRSHYRYDILGDSWRAMAELPAPRIYAAGGAVGSQTYVVGGDSTDTTTYIYDIPSDTWSSGPNTNVAHSYTGGTVIGTKLLVVAGGSDIVEMADAGGPTPTPTCAPPPPNMVSWWPGDRNTDDIIDGNNGTFVGNARYSTGEVGQAFSFHGSSYVQVPDAANLDFAPDAPITIDMWVYRITGDQVMHFIGKRDACGPMINYQMGINISSGEGLFFGAGLGNEVETGQDLPLNTWTHLTGTFDGSTYRFYINGTLAGTAAGTLGSPNNAPLRIGTSGDCGGFIGLIDEVELFDRALSQPEVQSIVNAGSSGKCRPEATPTPTPTPTPGPITLRAQKRVVNGINTVKLIWDGATSTNVDVYRDGVVIVTTANDGSYIDSTGDTGRARYVYRVCEAGTSTCSNNATVTFQQ